MDFRFLHAADLHLDSPLKGLARYEGAPVKELREATRVALRNLVELAIDERVDFVLLAGDLYDGDWKDFNTGLFLVQRLQELDKAGIPVFAIKGNHDAESRMTRELTMPPNVTMFGHRKPETEKLDVLRVAVHGQSFANAKVAEDLAADYPDALDGYFNIGLLHTSADGRAGHANYAPCSVDGLRARGYQYWALGHVHKREILSQDPWIVFPGCLQGRHVREHGIKGASIVTVLDHRVAEVEHRPLDVVRWAHKKVDVTECEDAMAVASAVGEALRELADEAGDRLLAVRLDVIGATSAHRRLHQEFERWLNEIRVLAGPRVWLEKVRFNTRAEVSTSDLTERDDAFASLMSGIKNLEGDDQALRELGKTLFVKLEEKLPSELILGADGFRPTDAEFLREALPEVRQLLSVRLSESREDQG